MHCQYKNRCSIKEIYNTTKCLSLYSKEVYSWRHDLLHPVVDVTTLVIGYKELKTFRDLKQAYPQSISYSMTLL